MPELLTRAWAASPRNAGRNHLGRVGGIISESGAASPWNAGRLELGTHKRQRHERNRYDAGPK